MARIDPRLQEKLNGLLLRAAAEFNRISVEISEAALEVQDLARDLDVDGKQKAAAIAADALEIARRTARHSADGSDRLPQDRQR